jgi:hypothetical protein
VITKCHSLLSHWWLVSAFAVICCVEPLVVELTWLDDEDVSADAAATPSHGTIDRATTTPPSTRTALTETLVRTNRPPVTHASRGRSHH